MQIFHHIKEISLQEDDKEWIKDPISKQILENFRKQGYKIFDTDGYELKGETK